MPNYLKIAKTDANFIIAGAVITLTLFLGIYGQYAIAETEALSVTVLTSSIFTVDTNNFPTNITPGAPVFATSTTSVTTNTTGGWYVELYGADRAAGNTTMDLDTDASVGITDDTEWVPGAATTSAGNATTLTSGDDVLAMRVMSASGTPRFWSTSWWGASDTFYAGGNLWAGFASTTATNKKIGQVSSGDYNSSAALNTVQYYLDVSTGQQTGAYSGNLIYTLVTP